MRPKNKAYAADNGGDHADGLSALHRRDLDALVRATEITLESANGVLQRYGELVSAAQRQFAVLLWRGTSPADIAAVVPSLDAAGRVVDAALSHGAALTEIALKLQLSGLSLFRHFTADGAAASVPRAINEASKDGAG